MTEQALPAQLNPIVLARVGHGAKIHAARGGRWLYTLCGAENTNNLRYNSTVNRVADSTPETRARFDKNLCLNCYPNKENQ